MIEHNLFILSIIYGLFNKVNSSSCTPNKMLSFLKKNVVNCANLQRKDISKNANFSDIENIKIKEAFIFSNYLTTYFILDINNINNIEFISLNDLNSNIDIKINDTIFSIYKSKLFTKDIETNLFMSYILQNKAFGLNDNIFEILDKDSLEKLFDEMKKIVILELSINSYEKKTPFILKISYLREIDKLYIFYRGYEFYLENFSKISYSDFYLNISPTYLQVFSDYITKEIINLDIYKNVKLIFLKSIVEKFNNKISLIESFDNILDLVLNLFKIKNIHYYIITNLENIKCFKVITIDEFKSRFVIKEIVPTVEDNQLNLKLNLVDKTTSIIITIDNILDYKKEFYLQPTINTVIKENIFDVILLQGNCKL